MLRAHMDTVAMNELIRSGGMPQFQQRLQDMLKPEAAYFSLSEGVRSCVLVFDLKESWQVPIVVEPLFMDVNAEIEIVPVMTAEELRKGVAAVPGQL
ncbi:hypothetical protein [Streptomyces sp. NPDC006879]|uniref:hypothetical protein n=1 Tax=Streptomyces sp. NPDC006879 TaxID=3364767 RepID=UPI00369E093A